MLINVPIQKAYIKSEFISDSKVTGKLIEGYVIAVRAIKSRPLLFTVHLENGAVYSGLPVSAICSSGFVIDQELPLEAYQPWSCLESPANAVMLDYLKDYTVKVPRLGDWAVGRYLYTIDYSGEGLAQDPEQHKCHNIIAIKAGTWVAMPNNYCVFEDSHFTEQTTDVKLSDLKRTSTYYRTE